MLRRVACLLFLLCLFGLNLRSQPVTETPRQPRILLLLDGSSSMLQPWSGNDIRFKAAARIVDGLMDSIYRVNPNVEFGLRVYGHQSPAQNNDCFDSRMEVMFSKNNITQMGLRLASLRPFGVSPIAYSLSQAAQNDLVDEARNAYAIILITDGGESCGGNICDVVRKLIEHKIYFRPYVISLVDYAPLKEQYACLGSYLKIAKPEDIGPSLNQIVEAYRPILSMPAIIGEKKTVGTAEVAPKKILVDIPPEKVELPAPKPRVAETTAVLRVRGLRPITTPATSWFRIAPRSIPLPKGPFYVYTPTPRSPDNLGTLPGSGVKETTAPTTIPAQRPGTITVPPASRVPAVPLAALPASDRLVPVAVRSIPWPRPGRLPVPDPGRFRMDNPVDLPAAGTTTMIVKRRDDTGVTTIDPDRLKPRNPEPPRPRADPAQPKPAAPGETTVKMVELPREPATRVTETKPVKLTPPPPPEVRVSRDTAKETQISIYFTDGKGKFYASSPQLRLLDAKTNAQVKQFYRTVDPSGNPDPQPIAAGTYNLMVATRSNLLLKNIVIEQNKNNKVIVKVTNGSLRFRYENNPTRPVTEFNATVNIRFEDGPINQKQRCSEELEYAPGNYHVEISTLPVFQLNTDIDFGAITQIDIPEPGFVQFTNTNNVGPVQLFSPLGNRFMRFYGLRVQGTPETQRVRLLPGAYEAHWMTNPGTPKAKEEVIRFNVRSNMMTEIQLN